MNPERMLDDFQPPVAAWAPLPFTVEPLEADGPRFVITGQYEATLATYEPDAVRRAEYTKAVRWAITKDPRQLKRREGWETRYFDSRVNRAWPLLRIWIWPERASVLHLSDISEP